jgi:hypothetical protein
MNKANQMEDYRLEEITGGSAPIGGTPLTGMLDTYYQIAMEEKKPAARAEAARVYNETLDNLLRQGVNCAGYRHIRI